MEITSAGVIPHGQIINSRGEAHVFSTSESEIRRIVEESGKVWTHTFKALNPAGNDDYVIWLQNTGPVNIILHELRVRASAATRVDIDEVTGAGAGGSTATPVSLKLGSGKTPEATLETGTDITNLTKVNTIENLICTVADTDYDFVLDAGIVLEKNRAIAILVAVGTADLSGTIIFAEQELR